MDLRSVMGNKIPQPGDYDEIDLTYVASGNGAGEIEEVRYKKNGNIFLRLILSYNSNNQINNVRVQWA